MDKNKRNIIKGGTAAIITTIPARAVWGRSTQVSGNLSGNLSAPTQSAFSHSPSKSTSFWKNHYVGASPFDFASESVLKDELQEHEHKFYVKSSWKTIYSELTINDYVGNYTYYDALYSTDEFVSQFATAKLNASIPELNYFYKDEDLDSLYIAVMNNEVSADSMIAIFREYHTEY